MKPIDIVGLGIAGTAAMVVIVVVAAHGQTDTTGSSDGPKTEAIVA